MRKMRKMRKIDDEKVLLSITIKHNPEFSDGWIAKDRDGDVSIYRNKPVKQYCYWSDEKGLSSDELVVSDCLSMVFKSLSWQDEEPKRISEMLGLKKKGEK